MKDPNVRALSVRLSADQHRKLRHYVMNHEITTGQKISQQGLIERLLDDFLAGLEQPSAARDHHQAASPDDLGDPDHHPPSDPQPSPPPDPPSPTVESQPNPAPAPVQRRGKPTAGDVILAAKKRAQTKPKRETRTQVRARQRQPRRKKTDNNEETKT